MHVKILSRFAVLVFGAGIDGAMPPEPALVFGWSIEPVDCGDEPVVGGLIGPRLTSCAEMSMLSVCIRSYGKCVTGDVITPLTTAVLRLLLAFLAAAAVVVAVFLLFTPNANGLRPLMLLLFFMQLLFIDR